MLLGLGQVAVTFVYAQIGDIPVQATATGGTAAGFITITATLEQTPTAQVSGEETPTPLPTMLPDQTLEGLTAHGQAITATAAAPVGLAIISLLLLWAGMRLLVWGRRRR